MEIMNEDYLEALKFLGLNPNEVSSCEVCSFAYPPIDVKIKYLPGARKVEKISNGDWVDLANLEDVTLAAGEFALINLGVAMELPEGWEAHVAPRSSTFKKWGIIQVNSVGELYFIF